MGTIGRSVQVQQQIDNADAVIASGDQHREIIAAGASLKLTRHTREEIERLIDDALEYLRRSTDELQAAENLYVAEQADDVPIRDARDAAAVEVLEHVFAVRGRIAEVFTKRALVLYGLDGETPRLPKALANHVDSAVQLMRNQPNEGRDRLGATISTEAIADSLAALNAPVKTHLEALVREKRENEAALTQRDRASEEWRLAYRSVSMMLASFYEMAGRRDLADRIRPTVRREAGFEPTPPEPDPASPAAS